MENLHKQKYIPTYNKVYLKKKYQGKQTANGPAGLNVQNHVEQAHNPELFKSKHNMGAKYALDYQRGTVTPTLVQVRTFKTYVPCEPQKLVLVVGRPFG